MGRTRIKICGVTSPADATLAASFGADAIGMILYPPSRRNVPLETAQQILAALPPFVTPVGVFVDAPVDHVLETSTQLGLRHIQLNGHETTDYLAALHGRIVLKAIRVDAHLQQTLDTLRSAIAAGHLSHLHGLVLETGHTAQPGGTGVENDWSAIARLQSEGAFRDLPPLIAAGGLRPDNVASVIHLLHPWAVDVSSGVEHTPGKKSPEKLQSFLAAVTDRVGED